MVTTLLARGQQNRSFFNSLFPFAPENLVSRDGFSRPIPRNARSFFFAVTSLYIIGNPHRAIPEYIVSRKKCVQMAFTAERPRAQVH